MDVDAIARKTAVIVDDELITRLDFAQMLAEMGIDICGEASDGFDAVEICREKRPDLVLMDIRMPVFDGMGASEMIIRDDLAGSVIIISAYGDEQTILHAFRAGVFAYLVKPVDRRSLFIAVHNAFIAREKLDRIRERAFQAEIALEDFRLIARAQSQIAYENSISEAEAYRLIQKTAMNKKTPMREIAMHILSANDETTPLRRAKSLLMKRHDCSEKQAYKRIVDLAEQNNVSLSEAADALLRSEA